MWSMVPFHIARLRASRIPLSAAAISLGVAVEQFLPIAWPRHTDAIIMPGHGCEIERGKNPLRGITGPPQKKQRAVIAVAEINPLESVWKKIALMKRRLGLIKMIQVLNPFLNTRVVP